MSDRREEDNISYRSSEVRLVEIKVDPQHCSFRSEDVRIIEKIELEDIRVKFK